MFFTGLKFYCFIILSNGGVFFNMCINIEHFKFFFFYKGFLDWTLTHFFPIAYRNTERNNNNQQKNPANSTLSPTLVVSVSFARKSLPGAQECLSNSLDGRHFLKRLCLTTESKEFQA